jgi:hypothetical protein
MAEQEAVDTSGLENDPAPDTTKDTPPADSGAEEADGNELPGAPEQEGDDEGNELPGAPEAPKGAPEKYEAFNLPEGFEFPEEALSKFTELAKSNGLSQEAAQNMVNFDIERTKAAEAAGIEADNKQVAEWEAANKKTHGDKYPEAYATAKRGFGVFSKETQQIFINAKFATNPQFFEDMIRLGKTISEDSFVKSETKVKDKTLRDKFSYVNKDYGK